MASHVLTITNTGPTITEMKSEINTQSGTRLPVLQPGESKVLRTSLAVGGVGCAPNLWAIHGKYYDLSSFVPQHPGGTEMILLGKGRDCTEMFESIHALSKRAVHKMLEKYEVQTPEEMPPPPEDTFSWEEGGFYDTLKKRVREHFDKTGSSHKATPLYWAKLSLLFCLWCYFISSALTAATLGRAMFCAATAGFLMNMLGFCGMHDGSHYGISKRPWVNQLIHALWSDWNLWSHFIWLRHHVYGHHSYTAIYRRDPDIVNIMPLVRKSTDTRYNKAHPYQIFSAFTLLTFLPNQHIGQALMYLWSGMSKRLFSTVPLEDTPAHVWRAMICIYITSILFHGVLPFLLLDGWTAYFLIVSYWTAQGVGYFINIAPNHDTLDTHINLEKEDEKEGKNSNKKVKRDWGVQQVVGSGNHTTDKGPLSWLITQLWGGMNYQIEHHLFPSVSHMHYAAISPIVEATCKEFSIPYTQHSWATALFRFVNLVSLLRAPIRLVRGDNSKKTD